MTEKVCAIISQSEKNMIVRELGIPGKYGDVRYAGSDYLIVIYPNRNVGQELAFASVSEYMSLDYRQLSVKDFLKHVMSEMKNEK